MDVKHPLCIPWLENYLVSVPCFSFPADYYQLLSVQFAWRWLVGWTKGQLQVQLQLLLQAQQHHHIVYQQHGSLLLCGCGNHSYNIDL